MTSDGNGELMKPWFLGLMADVCRKRRQTDEGLTLVNEALEVVGKTGESFCEPELRRFKGELTLQKFQVSGSKFRIATRRSRKSNTPHRAPNTQAEAEAKECFLKAVETARRQSAKSLELRAVMSLSRLWQQQGKKKKKARQMLAEIYGWFIEGFDIKDLQEAKALLEEL